MAYTAANLSLVAYGGGQKLWMYKVPCPDTSPTVYALSYFPGLNTIPLMAQDDIIICSQTSTTVGASSYVYVLAVSGISTTVCTTVYTGLRA